MLRANAHSWLATHPPIADRISAIEEGRFIRQLPLLDGGTPQELPGGAPVAAVKPAPVRRFRTLIADASSVVLMWDA